MTKDLKKLGLDESEAKGRIGWIPATLRPDDLTNYGKGQDDDNK